MKAKDRLRDCSAVRGRGFSVKDNVIVVHATVDGVGTHPTETLLEPRLRYRSGSWPVTVFLVIDRTEEIGRYSVTQETARRDWMDVCVVQFANANDQRGTALAEHQVVYFESPSIRQVGFTGQYGKPAPVLADWIRANAK